MRIFHTMRYLYVISIFDCIKSESSYGDLYKVLYFTIFQRMYIYRKRKKSHHMYLFKHISLFSEFSIHRITVPRLKCVLYYINEMCNDNFFLFRLYFFLQFYFVN